MNKSKAHRNQSGRGVLAALCMVLRLVDIRSQARIGPGRDLTSTGAIASRYVYAETGRPENKQTRKGEGGRGEGGGEERNPKPKNSH